MKKVFTFLLGLILITSCSSDDDAPANNDPILGTWVLVESSAFNPEECGQESTITFNPDNTGSGTFYISQLSCQAQSSSGSWANLGNSRYSITVPVLGRVEGTVTFINENRFRITTDDGSTHVFQRLISL